MDALYTSTTSSTLALSSLGEFILNLFTAKTYKDYFNWRPSTIRPTTAYSIGWDYIEIFKQAQQKYIALEKLHGNFKKQLARWLRAELNEFKAIELINYTDQIQYQKSL